MIGLLPLLLAAATPAGCNITEAQLLGAWKGGGSFEEMDISKDADGNHFNSWLHHRTELVDMKWTYADCQLKIFDPDNDALTFDFTVKRADRHRLTLVDTDGGATENYKRIKE